MHAAITVSAPPSPRTLRAAAIFGLRLTRAPRDRSLHATLAKHLLQNATPGSITLITGPSGAGKSTLLREVLRLARRHRTRVVTTTCQPRSRRTRRSLVDQFNAPLPIALAALGRAGLADAACFPRRPSELSEGERARLHLARAIHRARLHAARPTRPSRTRRPTPQPGILAGDEFLSVLDRITARGIARNLRRLLAGPSPNSLPALILATAHDDLIEPLRPDILVLCDLNGSGTLLTPKGTLAWTRTAVEPRFTPPRTHSPQPPPPNTPGSRRRPRAGTPPAAGGHIRNSAKRGGGW
jgi:uncharacterized protein